MNETIWVTELEHVKSVLGRSSIAVLILELVRRLENGVECLPDGSHSDPQLVSKIVYYQNQSMLVLLSSVAVIVR